MFTVQQYQTSNWIQCGNLAGWALDTFEQGHVHNYATVYFINITQRVFKIADVSALF